jgi:hypothetical protein
MALGVFILQAGIGLRASVPALVASSGWFAKFILLLLLGISVYTWAIIVERLRLYLRVQREDREFLAAGTCRAGWRRDHAHGALRTGPARHGTRRG